MIKFSNKKNSQYLLSLIFITFLSSKSLLFAQTPDPGISGSHAVLSQEYNLGEQAYEPPSFHEPVEVIGSVHYPADLSSGPFPVLVLLHGRHVTCYNPSNNEVEACWPCEGSYIPVPSYKGYDYFAELMASHGYIVISISANAINAHDNEVDDMGMKARGELVQHHLDLWSAYNTVGGEPFGNTFVGRLDLQNIGTMGHSRGGEGIIEHALLNIEQGSPYGIKAVLTLAPVDFFRPVLTGIPLLNIAPYCDGDVYDLQGVHYYDDARYLEDGDSAAKHSLLLLGANHNFFNKTWTPNQFPAGAMDDWLFRDYGQEDCQCGTSSSSNKRFSSTKQQAIFSAYASAFYRVYLSGQQQFAPILQVNDIAPPTSTNADESEIFMSYHPPATRSVILNNTIGLESHSTNNLSGAVSQSGLEHYSICDSYCIDAEHAQQPHGSTSNGLSQLGIIWEDGDEHYKNEFPDYFRDISIFDNLLFRCAINFESLTDNIDFSVEIKDIYGASSSQTISNHSNALFNPPGETFEVLPRLMMNTISLDLNDFSGIDITAISDITFKFNESNSGNIFVTDIILSSNNDLSLKPIASFTSDVTESCTGRVQFNSTSIFNPNEWYWDFGDGNTSNEENPTHEYLTNGEYDVKLKVINSIGEDSLTVSSYITINKAPAPVGTDGYICGEGVVELSASSSSNGDLFWYDEAVGGAPLGTGNIFQPNVTATKDFYVEEFIPGPIIGLEDSTYGTTDYYNNDDSKGLFFDALNDFVLESVKVYSDNWGYRVIEVLDGEDGAVLHSANTFIFEGEHELLLNFPIAAKDNYFMKINGDNVNLLYLNDESLSFPYTTPGVVSITGSNMPGQEEDFYFYFFDWKIKELDCLSARDTVTAFLLPNPTITTSGDVTINYGESTNLNATGGIAYFWLPTYGLSNPETPNPVASPTVTTTYTVYVTGTNECVDSASLTVTVGAGTSDINQSPDIDVFPNPSDGKINIVAKQKPISYNLKIFTVDGKLIYTEEVEESDNKTVDISQSEPGIYYLQIVSKDSIAVKKIVIN